jgi:DHA3 family tetracycline resistance protein-like MFS transporter
MLESNADRAARVYLVYKGVQGFALYTLVAAFTLYMVRDVGLSPMQFVFTGTLLEITITLSEVPTGVVADTVSRRLSVILGLVVLGLGFGLSAVPHYGVILLAQVVSGLGFTFMSGADIAWITDEVGEERARPLYVRGAQVRFVATLFGLATGAVLGSVALWVPFLVSGGLHVALAATLAAVMPETGFVGPGLGAAGDRNPLRALVGTMAEARATVRRLPTLWLVLGVTVLIGLGSEGIDRLWQIHLLDDVGLPRGDAIFWINGLHGAGLLVAAAAAEVVRRRADLHSRRGAQRTLLVIVAAIVVGMLAFATAPGFAWAGVAIVGVTAVRGVGEPVREAWVNQGLDARTRATVNSLASQAHAVGEIGGGVFGPLAAWLSVPRALVATALAHVPAVALLGRRSRRAEPLEGPEPAPAVA